jgi:hypothetical protein
VSQEAYPSSASTYALMADSNYPGDNQFAGLVEAATAAADQEVEWSPSDVAGGTAHQVFEGHEGHQSHTSPLGHVSPEVAYTVAHSGQYDPSLRSLRAEGEPVASTRPTTRKRKRGHEITGFEDRIAEKQVAARPTLQQSSLNRPPASVHAAAALFRPPSTSSKKYTRPPMSRLFSSLHLPPEEFLHLQSAAKTYMLADNHPERRDCVGQRGKTDSDMVKLKLWNCVQVFLDQEGNGEKFFGANARKADTEDGARSMTWPDDAQQIIRTCIPLLRRMVTNERQRRYAVESRKGGGDNRREGDDPSANPNEPTPPRASIDETEIPDTFTPERLDIFGDGLISDPEEASKWYEIYNAGAVLDKIFIQSGFPRVLFLPLIVNIDVHCRLYHGDQGLLCSDACKTRLVERLLELPLYRKHAPGGNPSQTVREVFNVVLTHLILTRYWHTRMTEATASSGPPAILPGRPTSNTKRSSFPTRVAQSSTGAVGRTNGPTPKGPLRLLIHIVRQDKCLLQPFHVSSNECPDIEALRKQIQDHYSLVRLQERDVTSLSEVTLKVWLPDGLVRVEDDGQWMVALLSAEAVEWMGGQLTVLLDT